jgi:hypothetical protein
MYVARDSTRHASVRDGAMGWCRLLGTAHRDGLLREQARRAVRDGAADRAGDGAGAGRVPARTG